MMVVAVVAILVVGPKDLPKMLRTFGKTMKSIRGLAGDFQKQFDEAVKDSDFEDVKNIASGKGFKPLDDIKKSTDAFKNEMKESMAAAEKSVSEGMPKDQLPEPVKSSAKPAAKKAAPKQAAAKKAPAKKPATKSAPVKAAVKKAPAKKAAPKKTATKKAAAAVKSA